MASPTFPTSLAIRSLELRAYQERDAEPLAALVSAERERLRRNFPEMVQSIATLDAAKAFIRENAAQQEDGKIFHYGIWTRDTPALAGQIKVKNISWDVPAAELSYFIGSGFLRRGYATEAVLAVMREAFERLQFNRIHARVIASNRESAELARKLGMVHEGRHRREFRCGHGELHDVDRFSVTREEYPGIQMKFQPILEP